MKTDNIIKSKYIIDNSDKELTNEELGIYYYELAKKAFELNDMEKYKYYLNCSNEYFSATKGEKSRK